MNRPPACRGHAGNIRVPAGPRLDPARQPLDRWRHLDLDRELESPSRVHPTLVASSSVRAMLSAFASLGLDAGAIQREAGFADADVDDPDGLLPLPRVTRLWEVADRHWGRPALGLLTGAAVPVGAYEVLDYLVITAPTLGEGLTDLTHGFAIVTRTVGFRVCREGGVVSCVLEWTRVPRGIELHLRDYSLAAVARRAREASGVAPARVDVAGPPLTTAEHYAEVFGAPARLRAPRDAVVYTARAWQTPLARADARLHRTLLRHVHLLLGRTLPLAPDALADRVRAELRRRAGADPPSMVDVARAVGLGTRTLQRRLHGEGVSFAGLVDESRACLARDLLGDRRLAIGDIAHRLGFSEPSAFSRAFRRWTGRCPRAFRAERALRR